MIDKLSYNVLENMTDDELSQLKEMIFEII